MACIYTGVVRLYLSLPKAEPGFDKLSPRERV